MNDKRVLGQSQLDYLWTNFGNLKVTNNLSETPSNEKIPTEEAVLQYLRMELAKANTDIEIESEIVNNIVTIRFKDRHGNLLDYINFQEGSKITKFDKFISTQNDVDKGYVSRPNILCLTIEDSFGQRFFLELSEINHSGSESDTIIVSVVGTKIGAELKIDNPIVNKTVELRATNHGLRGDIVIDPESTIILSKGQNGLSASYKWSGEQFDIKFKALTSNEYYLIKYPDEGTLYFITDLPCIFFRRQRYASSNEIAVDLEALNKRIDDLEAKEVPDNINQIIDEKINKSLSWEVI